MTCFVLLKSIILSWNKTVTSLINKGLDLANTSVYKTNTKLNAKIFHLAFAINYGSKKVSLYLIFQIYVRVFLTKQVVCEQQKNYCAELHLKKKEKKKKSFNNIPFTHLSTLLASLFHSAKQKERAQGRFHNLQKEFQALYRSRFCIHRVYH